MKKLSETYRELGIAFTFPIAIEDKNGNETYYEDSSGFWYRCEFDEKGNETYFENSDGPTQRMVIDRAGKVIEVDGKKYKLTAVKDYEYKAPAWVNWPV